MGSVRDLGAQEASRSAQCKMHSAAWAEPEVAAACRRASEQGKHLREVLAEDAAVTRHLAGEALDRLFDPVGYLGVTDRLIQRVLATHRKAR